MTLTNSWMISGIVVGIEPTQLVAVDHVYRAVLTATDENVRVLGRAGAVREKQDTSGRNIQICIVQFLLVGRGEVIGDGQAWSCRLEKTVGEVGYPVKGTIASREIEVTRVGGKAVTRHPNAALGFSSVWRNRKSRKLC